MKKISLGFLVMTLFLCGCQAKGKSDVSDYSNALAKAQEISVLSADTLEELECITEEKEIENFTTKLDVETWESSELPEDANKVGIFSFSQEETGKAGQKKEDLKRQEVCTITLYDSQNMSFEIAGVSMIFEVEESTFEDLMEYFE